MSAVVVCIFIYLNERVCIDNTHGGSFGELCIIAQLFKMCIKTLILMLNQQKVCHTNTEHKIPLLCDSSVLNEGARVIIVEKEKRNHEHD